MTKQTTTDTVTNVVFWPSPQDYCEALQTPQESFACPNLRAGESDLDHLGLPRPISGGFASVYKVITASEQLAVRCFLVKRADQQKRYRLISEHIKSNPIPYTVDFDRLPEEEATVESNRASELWFLIVDVSDHFS